MKLILLAATALIASPVIAQDTTTTAPATQTAPTTADPAQTGQMPATDPAQQTAPATDPATMPPAGAPAPAPMASTTGDPVGGYQPSQPAISGAATPGGPVTFQAAPPPSQAFPAPAPLETYPICKKGQYDKCRQRGGK